VAHAATNDQVEEHGSPVTNADTVLVQAFRVKYVILLSRVDVFLFDKISQAGEAARLFVDRGGLFHRALDLQAASSQRFDGKNGGGDA
jgi:hypothetical protein